jgi:nicotinate-nucleotide--dimethylbenzimidazole phosphoribosyltransferase
VNLEKILAAIKPIDKDIVEKAKNRSNELIMPFRAMGDLHELAEQLCGITQSVKPKVKRKAVFLMVADHGVVEENISAYPQSITLEMVKAFVEGVATISVLSKTFKSKLIVADVGMKKNYSNKVIKNKHITFLCEKIGHSTKNFKKFKAMTYNEAVRSIETGFNIANKYIKYYDLQLIATGDMGIGNTTSASAIASVFCNEPPENITGMGSQIDNDTLSRKIEVIKTAIAMHQPDKANGIDVLSKVGGFEIGAIAGVILAGAYNRIPVVLDGAVTTAAALIAYSLKRYVKEYMISSHLSADKSHQFMLDYLQLKPLLNLHMRLGEGSGAVLAFPIIKAAANIVKKVATFKDLGLEK